MSKAKKKPVSDIVEQYREKYPNAERLLLRDAILRKYPELNVRTLDRHLENACSDRMFGYCWKKAEG